ncbi:ATP-binding protein [Virgibacillus sp. NKC19-16]|uniref:ATP-binding protein n=1 Tax=Virgibacillus salidurans TaxID=2831673 RepID=UPI001F1CBA26|nr:ATP-binding protein [Virgibacillus sp. NKC19-16]UJL45788.1 ATP-binding protein [Virgibacillus sp. NKC19-16]
MLSITVSLITRLLFDFSYYKKKLYGKNETPLLLTFEEAHKYAPKSNLAKYRSSTTAIERIAKEGRKYGETLAIISQRPSEISETIFSQCNNFVAMRLTNPEDQNYVKKLLPDSQIGVTDKLPSLQSGEALLIGDSVIMPSVVNIDRCDLEPSSNDVKYIEAWKERWNDIIFKDIIDSWV